jgi:hypothetical protein
MKKKKEKGLGC